MINSHRTAIITGAAGALGADIAIRLASEGYKITITDLPSRSQELQELADNITKKEGEKPNAKKILVITGDVTKEKEVEEIVQKTVEHFGSLEVMVANHGLFYGSLLTNMPEDKWDAVMNVNAKGVFLCYKVAANQMLKQQQDPADKDRGCSGAGYSGANLCSAYAASKFAIRGLTQAAASELGRANITVNAYAPGFIGGTEMYGIFEKSINENFQLPEGAWNQIALENIRMKRLGEKRNVSSMVAYLASKDADWVTGTSFPVAVSRFYGGCF
ncbi:hypothetical protein Clacol_002273 [Clathrus columnatus]|uniref:NAD(P)-binding protein n=1 Tax=Clathrus columnatus TaxID=1419009 RepID=A0AAV5A4W5_9AGAM|nr:hypothetical protein Clacol_002273 [Clathrus columnatus]